MSKKRLFSKRKKALSVIDQALEQLRKTRAQLNESHPDLLDTMKEHLEKMEKAGVSPMAAEAPPQPEIPEWARTMSKNEADLELKIDRKKNLESIMKFLEIKTAHSPEFQDQLKTVLKETEF